MKSTASIFKSENFDNFLMTHMDVVRDFLKEVRVEAYVPEILVLDTNGKILVIKLFFNDNKYKVVKQAGAMCYQRKNHPVAAIMVFEAWIREQQADQPFSSRPISSYADKEEVISFDGMTCDGRRNGAILWFNRRKDNCTNLPFRSAVYETQSPKLKRGWRVSPLCTICIWVKWGKLATF
jgi:hypothetical protein